MKTKLSDRVVKSYKVLDEHYHKAQIRAAKEKTTVARIVEIAVIDYAYPNKTKN